MTTPFDPKLGQLDLDDATSALAAVSIAAQAVEKLGVTVGEPGKLATRVAATNGTLKVVKTVVAGGAAVASATGLTVAATSGAGIASGLAAAGGIVGGGMAVGPAVLAGGPAYLAAQGFNNTLFKAEDGLSKTEGTARTAARTATNVGAAAGVLGTGAAVVAGGTSGAAIMGTLATVGGMVGGGAIAGTVVLVAAPMAIAGAAGYAIYRLWGGGKK